MSELTAEDMKAIAEKLYPDHKWLIDQGGGTGRKPSVILYEPHVGPHFDHRFDPSLTGSSLYKCQALDVMMAFLNSGNKRYLKRIETRADGVLYEANVREQWSEYAKDPCTAALLALREGG